MTRDTDLIRRGDAISWCDKWIATFGAVEIRHTSAREYALDAVKDLRDALHSIPAHPSQEPPSPAPNTADLLNLIRWAHDTLYEINPSNYDHDEVCRLNDASVEVILGLAPVLGETHGKSPEWWTDHRVGPLPSPGVTAGATGPETFQNRVQPWLQACFGPEVSADRLERGDRLLEEVFELLQSGGYPRERVASLTGYVWSRPAGEPAQEVGGVMVTLAAYCLAHGLDMHSAGETELARIWTKVEAIRAKQAAKPRGSALPQEWSTPAPVVPAEGLDALLMDLHDLASDAYDNGKEHESNTMIRAYDAITALRSAPPVIGYRAEATINPSKGKDQ